MASGVESLPYTLASMSGYGIAALTIGASSQKLNEEMERNIELRKELVESKQSAILSSACEGITESQAAKLESLAEGVEFEDADSYAAKLETLKESYLPKEEVISEEVVVDEDEPLELEEEATPATDPSMSAYLNAISKSIKK